MPSADICRVFLLVGVELVQETGKNAGICSHKGEVGIAAVLGAV